MEEEEGSVQEAFELEENETVVAVRTNTHGHGGHLFGLEVTTSTGRQVSWGDLDTEHEGDRKRRSVLDNAKLGFCSGMVQTDGYSSRTMQKEGDGRSLTFHWMMD